MTIRSQNATTGFACAVMAGLALSLVHAAGAASQTIVATPPGGAAPASQAATAEPGAAKAARENELESLRAEQQRAAEEAVGLARVVPENAAIIVLDTRGRALSSQDLAGMIGRWRDHGREAAVFMIGGPDGLAESLLRRAELRLAFGSATWPHQLVRIMLLEQLYRALSRHEACFSAQEDCSERPCGTFCS